MRTSSICAGWLSNAARPFPIRSTVGSWPLTSSERLIEISSCSLSRPSSASWTWISSLSRSSWGSARFSVINCWRLTTICSARSSKPIWPPLCTRVRSSQASNGPRCSSGTPSSSQISLIGRLQAYAIRSTTDPSAPLASSRSSCVAVSVSNVGRSFSIRRMVNALANNLRRRVCTGGSAVCICASYRRQTLLSFGLRVSCSDAGLACRSGLRWASRMSW
ncbi:hypothetical protein NKG94_03465 [Micromonospora sp. M12]